MPKPTDARCVHRKSDPVHCEGCLALAAAMGLLHDRRPPLRGWYGEELIEAWGRAVGLRGPLFFVSRMREEPERVEAARGWDAVVGARP